MTLTLQEFTIPELKYGEAQLEHNYAYDIRAKWETVRPDPYKIIENFGQPISSIINTDIEEHAILYSFEDEGIALIDFSKRSVSVSMASSSKDAIDMHLSILKNLYEPEPDQIEGNLKVRFWYATDHGPRNVIRAIAVPKWEQIAHNYDAKTSEGLDYLVNRFVPSGGGGQLIIMNGDPGTGKSYYLRALLHAWKDWCTAEYVLDPENLFSGKQGYMADLVLKNSYDEEFDWIEDGDIDRSGKWKLLILEDCGDLLKVDASQHIGTPGLARLLNLVDGLIGQGLRVLILITTNEEFDKMHPAVVREGRTAATITFNPLSRKQAENWLDKKAYKLPEGKNIFTLAELYALTKENKLNKIKEPRGFGFRTP